MYKGNVLNFRKNLLIVFAAAALLSVVSGCATTEKSSWDPFQLVFPVPPEKPRIKYVGSLSTEKDVMSDTGSGITQTLFGADSGEGLRKPFGVTTDEDGRVYVSDIGRVLIFDKAAKRLSIIGQNHPVINLVRPAGIFYDRKNSLLYVADPGLDRVLVYGKDGRLVLELGRNGELKDPGAVVVDSARNKVYVTNTKLHDVSVFDTKGGFIKNIGERGKEPGYFNFPTQLAIDGSGNIYVVDAGNFRIQVIDPDGKYKMSLGAGVGMSQGYFARPRAVAVSAEGYAFVVDSTFEGVTTFDKLGRLLLVWGKGGIERGLLRVPSGIHIDEKGQIYIVSQWNARVDIFQLITYPEDKELLEPTQKN